MSYEYNPHLHAKIWLSNNPSIFMNLENQIRLIEMREKNPKDTIHLTYDSSLLSEKANEDLKDFCTENNIIPIDANDKDFEKQLQTEEERVLYAFYKDEITHQKEGGNLALASDILRWLSPVYRRGTYSDFDFPIDTKALPETISVERPLLLNIGSLKIGKKDFIIANNDFVAIVDEKAAAEQIAKIHRGLISKLTKYETDFVEKTEKELGGDNFLNYNILSYMKNRSEAIYITKSNDIAKKSTAKSSREIRAYLQEIMTEKDKYLEFNKLSPDESNTEVITRLRGELKKQLGLVKWLFFTKEYHQIKNILLENDDIFLAYFMKKERSLYLKSIVICTTGPLEVSNSLFDGYVMSSTSFDEQVIPYSFNHYNLQKSFKSQNSIPLHQNFIGMLKFLGTSDGELNDSSWLEEGRELQKTREEKLLFRQQKLAENLPSYLFEIKEGIEAHVLKLEKNSKGFSGLFYSSRKKKKIAALKQSLACFNEDRSEFDIDQFKSVLADIQRDKKSIFAGIFHKRTQKLVEDLEQLCHDAVVYRVVKNKKISMAREKPRGLGAPSSEPEEPKSKPQQNQSGVNHSSSSQKSKDNRTGKSESKKSCCFPSFFSTKKAAYHFEKEAENIDTPERECPSFG